MLTDEERAIIEEYEPRREAELARLGIAVADQQWLFAGTDTRPARAAYEADLARLRSLPDRMGVEAFCREVLGFDYHAARRALLGEITPPAS
jgi:hypothetical protein